MKKTILILTFLLVMLAAVPARANDDVVFLRNEVASASAQCPISMGIMGNITDIAYVEKAKEVQIFFTITPNAVNLNVLRQNRKATINNVKLALSSSEDSKRLVSMMIKAGASLAFTYKEPDGGDTFTVTLSVDDLKDIIYNPLSETETYRMLLENQIALENARCPYEVAPGMTMSRVVDLGDKLMYECTVNESMYNIPMLRGAADQLKQNMLSMFADPTVKAQLVMLSSLGKGMLYRYKGNVSGEAIDILFTPAEIIRNLAQ